MKIVEFLTQYGTATVGEESIPFAGTFTVDTSAPYVDCIWDDGLGIHEHTLWNAGIKQRLQLYDNFILLSAGLSIPKPFDIYENAFLISLKYEDTEHSSVEVFGDPLLFTFANYENPLFTMHSPQAMDMLNGSFGATAFGVDNGNLKISMAGVPEAMDEASFEVSVFIKILHNTPMH